MQTRIKRSFGDLSEEEINDIEQISAMVQWGWSKTFDWVVLFKSQRILIISEAGTGKTYECQVEQASLWGKGEAAFYIDLAELSANNFRDILSVEEEERFEAWLTSQSDVATIFLDSIDELGLTLGSFNTALKRLSKALVGHLGRVKIVITTRPVPFDQHIIQRFLPVPKKDNWVASGDAFADIAMNRGNDTTQTGKKADTVPVWRIVALMPLSDDQIKEMATLQGVQDAGELLTEIRLRNAQEFARRPLDLIELCMDWRVHHRIRTHREQVAYNIAVKLKPRTDRKEKSQLSADKAQEGASRLALAAMLTRKLTLRHSLEADMGGKPGTAMDPETILPDWPEKERKTLLERALFGFATYGRVRFHHQSVIEYLASQRIEWLLGQGMSKKAVKRLLFVETPQKIRVVKPSMRPVAAWLALSQSNIFNEVLEREPNVLLNYADPESLSTQHRIQALRSYVEQFGQGGWRGLHVPNIQVYRFASNELAPEVFRLWESGIENPEVREFLMELIATAPMAECADIAYSVVMQKDATYEERKEALFALKRLNDSRLDAVLLSMENDQDIWSERLFRSSILDLFPSNISVKTLCRILGHVSESTGLVDELDWHWSRLIDESEMTHEYLDALRSGLTNLVIEGVEWRKEWTHFISPRPHLLSPLAAVCLRLLIEGYSSDELIYSCVITIRLAKDDYSSNGEDKPINKLRVFLEKSPPDLRESVFWACDKFNQIHHSIEDSWNRLFTASYHGAIGLNFNQDASWVLENLLDPGRPLAERAMMLEAAMREIWDTKGSRDDHMLNLKKCVADNPDLTTRLENFLKPTPKDREVDKLMAKEKKRQKQAERRRAKDHASWVLFWREVANNPQTALSPDRADNTAWNLWKAMKRSGKDSRASGWNRRFIEKHFNKEIADQMRLTMMDIWRNDRPTLRRERPEGEKGTTFVHWQLGLAAIAAESEDPDWARKLSTKEAELAVRYAPIELNSFPAWLESLAQVHPAVVVTVLGPELENELDKVLLPNSYLGLLQDISHAASDISTLFLPQLCAWLDEHSQRIREGEDNFRVVDRLRRVVYILLDYDSKQVCENLRIMASQKLTEGHDTIFTDVWLPVLIRLDPVAGSEVLERILSGVKPEKEGLGEKWIGMLFDNRHNTPQIDLRKSEFTPSLLLRLVRLAYIYVNPVDDIRHERTYSPGPRDYAQEGRNTLLNALLETKGSKGWQAKLELADDPLFVDFRDRALSLARDKVALEADEVAFSESDVVVLDSYKELSIVSRDEMYEVMMDRLDDLDDLLLQDYSPRAVWAGISDEKIMRREIARELNNSSNHIYTVDQESVTADEKETDIRLRATASEQQAIIELKIGEKSRSGRVLRNAIKKQLVTKYMAPEDCRSGCFLVTIATDKTWRHPDTNESLDVSGLEDMLKTEASKIVCDLGMTLRISARVLDLRPRLLTEVETK